MATLVSLPEELLSYVVSILEHPPPSQVQILNAPKTDYPLYAGSSILRSHEQPLKALSLVCPRLRRLVIGPLLRHVRVDIASNMTDLFDILARHNLSDTVESALILPPTPLRRHDTLNDEDLAGDTWSVCHSLLSQLNINTLTLALPATIISFLACEHSREDHAWVFKVPYQIFQLHLSPEPNTPPISHCHSTHNPSRPSRDEHILTLRPWTHLTYNIGSSVPAYSLYEYFSFLHPSWLSLQSSSGKTLIQRGRELRYLRSFTFIGVFPFGGLLLDLADTLRLLPLLEDLRLQLIPLPHSDEAAGYGRAEGRDLWLAFEEAGTHIEDLMRVAVVSGDMKLRRVEFLDYGKSAQVADLIDENVQDVEAWGWTSDGAGVWTRELRVKDDAEAGD